MSIYRVLIFGIALLAGSPVFAQDYEIRLTRPDKVGEKSEVIVSGEMSEQMTMTSQGKILQEKKSSLSATFQGTTTVLKVDDLQRATELKLLVSKCHKKMDGNDTEEEVLAKGTQVVVRRRDSKTEFLIDGKVVPKDVAEVLGLFFSLPHSKVTDDDIFGTKERKKVGDSWAMNSKLAAKDSALQGVKVDVENITGSTKIEEVVVVGGKKCLRLSGKMEISKFAPPLPAGMAVEKSKMSVSASGVFPVDTSIGALSDKTTMTIEVVAKGKPTPDAPELTMSMKMTKSTHTKSKPLK